MKLLDVCNLLSVLFNTFVSYLDRVASMVDE
jgi:hypothetical protein